MIYVDVGYVIRMELSGVYFLVSISIVSVLVKEFTQVSQAKVGLAMVYTLQLTGIDIYPCHITNVGDLIVI